MNMRTVLSTKKLDPELIDWARRRNIHLEVSEMISIKLNSDEEIRRVVNSVADTVVVFTSKNAVVAVAGLVDTLERCSSWRIYAIDGATASSVDSLLKKNIRRTAPSAHELAEKIVRSESPQNVVFFCGSRRLDHLPELLQRHGFVVQEVIVYETVNTPVSISKQIDAVLFFSPSAVQSFFSANQLGEQVVCYSVGNTTTEELLKHTRNRIITAKKAAARELVMMAAELE